MYPEIVEQTLRQIYVDDWMGGEDDLKKAVTLVLTVDALLRQAKMKLNKWITSSLELKEALKKRIVFSNEPSVLARET